LIWEKRKVEASSAADSQEVLVERVDGSGLIAGENSQTILLSDQWKGRGKRQVKAEVSRAAKDVAKIGM